MRVAVALLCLIVIIVGTTADSTKDEKSGISRVMRGVRNGNSAKKKPQEKVGGKRTRKPRRKIKSKGRKVGSKRPGNRRGGKRGGKRSNKNPGRKAAAKKSTKKRGKVSKSKSVKKTNRGNQPRTSGTSRQALKGNDCDYIDLGAITTAGTGCATNGVKFVIKGNSGVRKQFLYVDGKVIIALTKLKFAECTAFTDITSQVNCKAVAGLDVVSLVGTNTPATPGATTSSSSSGEVALLIGGLKIGLLPDTEVQTYGSCSLPVGPYPVEVGGNRAATLDGSVYSCGGSQMTGGPIADCFMLGSTGGTWIKGPSLQTARTAFTMNLVGTQLVAIGGQGATSSDILTSVEVLKSGSSWQTQSYSLSSGTVAQCAATVSSTEVALVGAIDPTFRDGRLNVDTGNIVPLPTRPVASLSPSCAVVEGVLYVAGGFIPGTQVEVITSAFSLDLSANSWTTIASLNQGRLYAGSALLNGKFVVFGGTAAAIAPVGTYETYSGGAWTSANLRVAKEVLAVAVTNCP